MQGAIVAPCVGDVTCLLSVAVRATVCRVAGILSYPLLLLELSCVQVPELVLWTHQCYLPRYWHCHGPAVRRTGRVAVELTEIRVCPSAAATPASLSTGCYW